MIQLKWVRLQNSISVNNSVAELFPLQIQNIYLFFLFFLHVSRPSELHSHILIITSCAGHFPPKLKLSTFRQGMFNCFQI